MPKGWVLQIKFPCQSYLSLSLSTAVWCITKTEKAESEAQRGKRKGTLESESRNAIQCIVVRRAPAALYWCGNVVIDRRGDQLGKVLVCVHALTIQHRGRATRSIDHYTHGHRLGQYKAQTVMMMMFMTIFAGD